MKKVCIVIIFLCWNFSAYAETIVHLSWTHNASSIQAILYDALVDYGKKFEEFPDINPIIRENWKVTLKDEKNSLLCESKSSGMLPVQKYMCEFSLENKELPWTENALSPQAVLHNALSDYVLEHRGTEVVIIEGGTVTLSDDQGSIVCESEPSGIAPVQRYRSKFDFKEPD